MSTGSPVSGSIETSSSIQFPYSSLYPAISPPSDTSPPSPVSHPPAFGARPPRPRRGPFDTPDTPEPAPAPPGAAGGGGKARTRGRGCLTARTWRRHGRAIHRIARTPAELIDALERRPTRTRHRHRPTRALAAAVKARIDPRHIGRAGPRPHPEQRPDGPAPPFSRCPHVVVAPARGFVVQIGVLGLLAGEGFGAL